MCAVGAGPGAGEGLLLLLMAHKLPTLWPTEEAIQTLDHPFPKPNCGEPCQRSFDLIWPRPAFLPFQTFNVRVCLPLPALRSFTGHRSLSAEALPVLRYPGLVPCVGRSFVSSETREVGRRSPSKVAKDSQIAWALAPPSRRCHAPLSIGANSLLPCSPPSSAFKMGAGTALLACSASSPHAASGQEHMSRTHPPTIYRRASTSEALERRDGTAQTGDKSCGMCK